MTEASDDLRSRAVAQLDGPDALHGVRPNASAALGVLYELASTPATAPKALALLHELQVHQVEVDLQAEELHRSRLELETSLFRQTQLYDCAPVAYLTVDGNAVLQGLNLRGATLLGYERALLLGMSLENFLTPQSVRMLRASIGRVAAGADIAATPLQLRAALGTDVRRLHASLCADPAGAGFLIAAIDAGAARTDPAD